VKNWVAKGAEIGFFSPDTKVDRTFHICGCSSQHGRTDHRLKKLSQIGQEGTASALWCTKVAKIHFNRYICGRVIKFVECGLSHHITRYSHTLTQIHIGPQNSCRWPLCKSANVDIAAENIAETY
jgi:hypothetical protein